LSSVEVFEALADKYDLWYERNVTTALNELRLVQHMVKDKPRPCVEIGSGSGYFAQGSNCDLGIDPSLSMIKMARRRGVESIAAFGENIPLRDKSVGTVLMVVTLCFLDNPSKVIQEVKRILKDGGSFIVCIVPRESFWGRLYIRLSISGHPFYKVARFYSIKDVLTLLMNAGFKYIRMLATLSYKPWERPRPEEPKPFRDKEGFVCIEFSKG